jgi:hypothetical protein
MLAGYAVVPTAHDSLPTVLELLQRDFQVIIAAARREQELLTTEPLNPV